MNYYDAILLTFPTLFIVSGGIAVMTPVTFTQAILTSSILSLLALSHGLFINPPIDAEDIYGIDSTEKDNSTLLTEQPHSFSDD